MDCPDTMDTSEDTQDAIYGSEDTQFSMVEPEDNITFVKGRRE